MSNPGIQTHLHHSDEHDVHVVGASNAGSYHMPLHYHHATTLHADWLATNMHSCWQPISIQCYGAASLVSQQQRHHDVLV